MIYLHVIGSYTLHNSYKNFKRLLLLYDDVGIWNPSKSNAG